MLHPGLFKPNARQKQGFSTTGIQRRTSTASNKFTTMSISFLRYIFLAVHPDLDPSPHLTGRTYLRTCVEPLICVAVQGALEPRMDGLRYLFLPQHRMMRKARRKDLLRKA